MISEEEMTEVKKIQGSIRGTAFQTDAIFIKAHYDAEGLNHVESALAENGFKLKFDGIKAMEWLPLSARALEMLLLKDIFRFEEKDFYKMGEAGSKQSFIIRLLAKFFLSPETVFKSAPIYWSKYYSVGKILPVVFNEGERFVELRLVDFKAHVYYCYYLAGFFRRLVQHNYPKDEVKVEETKCVFRGDDCHEYKFWW